MKIRQAIYIIGVMLASLSVQTGCDVHEWPVEAEYVPFYLNLDFETAMSEQEYLYSRAAHTGDGIHDIRYVIRAYPMTLDGKMSSEYHSEFVYSKPVETFGQDYGYRTSLELPEGKYRLMVWTDFVDRGSVDHKYYDCDNFNSIVLHGSHKANTDYRDAFSGMVDVELVSTIQEGVEVLESVVKMARPMAKYTFISTDLQEFVSRELIRLSRNESGSDGGSRVIDLEDYEVVVYYPMYLPNTYNLSTDKAVNSGTGVQYSSNLVRLNENEVSMGFDYVVINDDPDAKVTVQIGLFDKEGTQIAKSEQFNIPLKRSVNMLVRGQFMTVESDGGISIDPSFNGDHNIVLP